MPLPRLLTTVFLASALTVGTFAPALAARTDLTLGMVLEPPHLDPTAGAAAAIDEIVYANVFEGLTRIDKDGTVQPDLATSWEISEDGLTYVFKLHEGVSFHDGSAFDADDVVFSLDRARAEDSVNAQKALFEAIETVEATDPSTVTITLSRPDGAFLYNMGWGDAVMVAPESAGTNKEKPVGTGPFSFVKWNKGSSVEIARNPDYWGEQPALEKAVFRFIPDAAAATSALLAGDVQAFPNLPAPEAVPQFEADPRFTVVIGSTEGETVLALNNSRPPFDNLLVRQAIAHAINRQEIIDGAMFGQGTPIGSHFAPHHPAYVDLTGQYPHDVEKAKSLLAKAGFADGFKTTLKLPPPSYARRGGEIVASQLRKIGIDVEIIPVEWAQWLDQAFTNGDYDMTIVSHTEPNDIGIYARDDYYFGYADPDFKAIMARLNETADEADRNALFGEAQRKLAEDSVNGFLFQLAKAGVWDAGLEGLWENSPIQANDLTGVRWKE